MRAQLETIAAVKGWKHHNIIGDDLMKKIQSEDSPYKLKYGQVLFLVDVIRTRAEFQKSSQIVREIYTGSLMILLRSIPGELYAWKKINCIDVAMEKQKELQHEIIANSLEINSWEYWDGIGKITAHYDGIVANYQITNHRP